MPSDLTPATLAELKRSKATGKSVTVDSPCDCLDDNGNSWPDCTCDHGIRHRRYSFENLLSLHADALIDAAEERNAQAAEIAQLKKDHGKAVDVLNAQYDAALDTASAQAAEIARLTTRDELKCRAKRGKTPDMLGGEA